MDYSPLRLMIFIYIPNTPSRNSDDYYFHERNVVDSKMITLIQNNGSLIFFPMIFSLLAPKRYIRIQKHVARHESQRQPGHQDLHHYMNTSYTTRTIIKIMTGPLMQIGNFCCSISPPSNHFRPLMLFSEVAPEHEKSPWPMLVFYKKWCCWKSSYLDPICSTKIQGPNNLFICPIQPIHDSMRLNKDNHFSIGKPFYTRGSRYNLNNCMQFSLINRSSTNLTTHTPPS